MPERVVGAMWNVGISASRLESLAHLLVPCSVLIEEERFIGFGVLPFFQFLLDHIAKDGINFQEIDFASFPDHAQESALQIGVHDIRLADFSKAAAGIDESQEKAPGAIEEVF